MPKEKERLDEVKAILRRLQRITTESEPKTVTAAKPTSRAAAQRAATPVADASKRRIRPQGSRERTPRSWIGRVWRRETLVAATGATIGLAVLVTVAVWPRATGKLSPDTRNTINASANQNRPLEEENVLGERPDPAVNAEAQKLMDSGKVTAARKMLLADPSKLTPEGALMLARSYDPNFVRLISQADAAADPQEAERWYRIWYEIAGRQGLALDAGRLELLIKSMQ